MKFQFFFVIFIKFLIELINALPLLLKSHGDLEWQSMANNKWNCEKKEIRFSFGVYFKEQFTNVKNATSIYSISLRFFFQSN